MLISAIYSIYKQLHVLNPMLLLEYIYKDQIERTRSLSIY